MVIRSEDRPRHGFETQKYVYFAHGKESGPWGSKILALAETAKRHGYQVESPDYSDITDPDKRVERLLNLCSTGGADILVGSSMGGYVAAVASSVIKPRGLFLMAPAFYIPGYGLQEPQPAAGKTVITHGWNDEVVPVEHSIRFAGTYRSQLHLLDSDHRLSDMTGILCSLFDLFLDDID